MRGGRGFVILKNGATINVNIAINDSEIVISQTGKANASYFPELPRNLALTAAVSAEPIKWVLYSKNPNTLVGQKNTLINKNGSIEPGTIDVIWTRIN